MNTSTSGGEIPRREVGITEGIDAPETVDELFARATELQEEVSEVLKHGVGLDERPSDPGLRGMLERGEMMDKYIMYATIRKYRPTVAVSIDDSLDDLIDVLVDEKGDSIFYLPANEGRAVPPLDVFSESSSDVPQNHLRFDRSKKLWEVTSKIGEEGEFAHLAAALGYMKLAVIRGRGRSHRDSNQFIPDELAFAMRQGDEYLKYVERPSDEELIGTHDKEWFVLYKVLEKYGYVDHHWDTDDFKLLFTKDAKLGFYFNPEKNRWFTIDETSEISDEEQGPSLIDSYHAKKGIRMELAKHNRDSGMPREEAEAMADFIDAQIAKYDKLSDRVS